MRVLKSWTQISSCSAHGNDEMPAGSKLISLEPSLFVTYKKRDSPWAIPQMLQATAAVICQQLCAERKSPPSKAVVKAAAAGLAGHGTAHMPPAGYIATEEHGTWADNHSMEPTRIRIILDQSAVAEMSVDPIQGAISATGCSTCSGE